MKYKEFNVKYNNEGNGSIEGYASTWTRTPDSYGDIVKEGAFTKTLEERWNGGKGIPLLWAHKMDDINSYIGRADAEEDEKGLHFMASFDGTDEAQRVRELYKDGRLRKFSFAFDVKDEERIMLEDGHKANELRELDLFEISCVCVPANDDAGVVGVKAGVTEVKEAETEPAEPAEEAEEPVTEPEEAPEEAKNEEPDVKSGRRNSKKDADAIREAITLLEGVLGEFEEAEEPEVEEDEAKANEASEEPEQSNSRKDALLEYINTSTAKEG